MTRGQVTRFTYSSKALAKKRAIGSELSTGAALSQKHELQHSEETLTTQLNLERQLANHVPTSHGRTGEWNRKLADDDDVGTGVEKESWSRGK